MVVCKYYQSGRCRYGESCKYEHVGPVSGSGGGGGGGGGGGRAPSDPFSTPPNKTHHHQHQHQHQHQHHSPGKGKGHIEIRPLWPLTCVALEEKPEDGNALSDEWSPEEMRAMAYSLAPQGVGPQVTQKELSVVADQCAKRDVLVRAGAISGEGGPGGGGGGMVMTVNGGGHGIIQPNDPFAPGPVQDVGGDPFKTGGGGGGGGGAMFALGPAQGMEQSHMQQEGFKQENVQFSASHMPETAPPAHRHF